MEDDDINTPSGGSLLTLALSVLAILLGGAGLYFGMNASQQLSPLADSMEAGSGAAVRLEKSISALETQLAELRGQSSEVQSALNRMRIYSSQSEQAVKQLASGMQENRTELVKLAGRLNELLESTVPSAPAPSAVSTTNQAPPLTSGEANSSQLASSRTYAIVSGDNFVKVANKLGVELQALLDANPGVDPRRLRIGQEINIPPAP
ncbi:MAG: LysM peptidoglycan-binding domain-containing protein [Opitutales bacterium]